MLVETREIGEKQAPGEKPPARRGRAWLIVLILVAIGAAAIAWRAGWLPGTGVSTQTDTSTPRGRRAQMQMAPASVTEATVTRGDIKITLQALGTVTSTSTVTVRTQVSGQLIAVNFREGQDVKQGDLLAEIDPRPFQAALAQAQGQLARDQALLQGAQVDLQRYQGLAAQNAVPRQQLDTQKALVAQYAATVEADRAQVQTATINLDFARIKSPVDGRAGLRQVDSGNYVTPGDANGIVVITRLKPISVVFSVPEDRLSEIARRLNAGAQLPVHASDRTGRTKLAEGTLQTFDSQIDQTTGTIKLRASFPNDDLKLFPNQFVNIVLDIDTRSGVAVAPSAGIQRGASGTFAYVINADQTVAVRPVTLGVTEGENVEVTAGLAPGDRIVVEGADRLREGAKVDVRAAVGSQPNGQPAAPAAGAQNGPEGRTGGRPDGARGQGGGQGGGRRQTGGANGPQGGGAPAPSAPAQSAPAKSAPAAQQPGSAPSP